MASSTGTEFLPPIESVTVAKLNEQMEPDHG